MNPPNHSVDLLSLYLPPSPSPRRVLRGSRLQAIGAGLHLFFKEFIERHQHDHPPSFLCVCVCVFYSSSTTLLLLPTVSLFSFLLRLRLLLPAVVASLMTETLKGVQKCGQATVVPTDEPRIIFTLLQSPFLEF